MREGGRILVHGAELRYERELDGDGTPLILLHAGIANLELWDDVVDELPGRPWVRYDLRGFGESSLPPGSYDVYRDLLGVLDALAIPRAVLCGISFGGGVAIDATLAAPDRVAGLIAACTGAFGGARDPDLAAQAEEADAAGEAGDIERAVELELRIWVDGPQRGPDELDPALRERARALNRSAWAAGMGGEGEALEPFAAGRLGEIACPTLVIDAELDQPSKHASCRQLADEIKGARLVVIPGVAHLPPLEAPAAFAGHVRSFLDEHGL
jgi:pimeloyl-ACP methyl ester carboxylesterase